MPFNRVTTLSTKSGLFWSIHERRATAQSVSFRGLQNENHLKDTYRVPTTFALSCPLESLIDYATFKLYHMLWWLKKALRRCTRSVPSKLKFHNVPNLNSHQLYWSAFEKCVHKTNILLYWQEHRFRNYPPIRTLEENETFCAFLTALLNEQLGFITSSLIPRY